MSVAIFLIALGAAGVMGFANQRGGTCTVAAIEEIVDHGCFGRARALLETSLWIAGGLLVLGTFGRLPQTPNGYSASIATVSGGILFGIGAFVNRACIFGAVARLGSGEWAYLGTPVGFFAGVLIGNALPEPGKITGTALLLSGPIWLALIAAILIVGRSFFHARRIRMGKKKILEAVWSPHFATMIIGLTFLVALQAGGAWTYSEYFSDIARGHSSGGAIKLLLNLALLTGAVVGGWTAGKNRFILPDLGSVVRTTLGGIIMGLGGSLIPGGNTGLVLIGMPLLWPYAWLAFGSICLTIYVAIRITRLR